jgi:preprotein translocase subunit SecA
MRIFGDPERTKNMLRRVGMREGEAIESNMLTGQIERAQRKVEAHNFDARKSLLEYDDVANDQRRLIYQQRNNLMQTDDISESLAEIRTEVVNGVFSEFIPEASRAMGRRRPVGNPCRASSGPPWLSELLDDGPTLTRPVFARSSLPSRKPT